MSLPLNLEMGPLGGSVEEPDPLDEDRLPALWLSILPIMLPVLLVSLNTTVELSRLWRQVSFAGLSLAYRTPRHITIV